MAEPSVLIIQFEFAGQGPFSSARKSHARIDFDTEKKKDTLTGFENAGFVQKLAIYFDCRILSFQKVRKSLVAVAK